MMQEPPYDTPAGNAVQPVVAMVIDPASGKAFPADTATPSNPVNGAVHNAAVVVPLDSYLLGGTAGYSATTATVLWQANTAGYESLVSQITANSTASTIITEGSNDGGTTWVSVFGQELDAQAASAAQTARTTPSAWQFPCMGMMRQRISASGGGTVTVVPMLRDAPIEPNVQWTIAQVQAASANPGCTTSRVKSTASTNATNLKNTAGNLLAFTLSNTTASARYLKFYNKASAPTVGTDAPFFTVLLPPTSTIVFTSDIGKRFATGIAFAITGAVADSDTTATAADDVHGEITWA